MSRGAQKRALERVELPFAKALALAGKLVEDLNPVVARVKVVGSLRRQVPTIGEIDLLAEPIPAQGDMFGANGPDIQPIRGVVSKWGRIEKNGDRYLNIRLDEPLGFSVDLFLCHPPAEWGSLLAIRTGPSDLSTSAVTLLRHRGLRHEGGRVVEESSGLTIPTPDEETFFALAGLPCYPPAMRGRSFAAVPLSMPKGLDEFERRESWGSVEGVPARARATDPETSHAAAGAIGSGLESMHDVLRCLELIGSGHDEAIVDAAPRLSIHRTDARIRTARSDAVRKGWIVHTGTFATTAAGGSSRVWKLTDAGLAELTRNRRGIL